MPVTPYILGNRQGSKVLQMERPESEGGQVSASENLYNLQRRFIKQSSQSERGAADCAFSKV